MTTATLFISALVCQPLSLPVQQGQFIAIGDTQRTTTLERLIGREQNDEAREYLQDLIGDEKKDFTVHLGDMVGRGKSMRDWRLFDLLRVGLNTPYLLPVLGNHEYHGGKHALDNAYQRFPFLKDSNWYARKYGELGLIFLNSNHRHLSKYSWLSQIQWYESCLSEFQKDASVKKILIFTHHAPYSNGRYTSDDEKVKRAFLKQFKDSPKTVAFVSGHTHSYQHFVEENKHFIVSGGGGGPRTDLTKTKHQDTYLWPTKRRPFHYLVISQNKMAVRGFNNPQETPFIMQEFDF